MMQLGAANTQLEGFAFLTDPTEHAAFEGVVADTEPLRSACYRIRHQVYCTERGFERAEDHPDGLETDEHDAHSLHGLLRCRQTGEGVGTVRLVLYNPGASDRKLPMYQLFERNRLDMGLLPPPSATAEISRFAISKEFRRRLRDGACPLEHGRAVSGLALGLMAIAVHMRPFLQIENLCAVMEPTLIRLLARCGIRWHAVGPLLEHHGLRQPCIARVDELIATVAAERPDVWASMAPRPSTSRPHEAFVAIAA